jgi:hypothetical protein
MYVRLKQMTGRFECFSQQSGLIVVSRTGHAPVDFLQTNQIGIFGLDHVDDALQPVLPIPTSDAFVNVVGQQTHAEIDVG